MAMTMTINLDGLNADINIRATTIATAGINSTVSKERRFFAKTLLTAGVTIACVYPALVTSSRFVRWSLKKLVSEMTIDIPEACQLNQSLPDGSFDG